LIEALLCGLFDDRPRKLLGAVVLGGDRADEVAGEGVRLDAQGLLLVAERQRERPGARRVLRGRLFGDSVAHGA
jgi:hypothetical protein